MEGITQEKKARRKVIRPEQKRPTKENVARSPQEQREILIEKALVRVVRRLYNITLPLDQRILVSNRELAEMPMAQSIFQKSRILLSRERFKEIVGQLKTKVMKRYEQQTEMYRRPRSRPRKDRDSDSFSEDGIEKLFGSDTPPAARSSTPPRESNPLVSAFCQNHMMDVWQVIKQVEAEHLLRTQYSSRIIDGLRNWKVIEFPADTKDLDFYVLPGVMTPEEVKGVFQLHKDASAKLISDRHDELDYIHKVWRIEDPIINQQYALFAKLMFLIECIDYKYWKRLRKHDHIYPETEFILYDRSCCKNEKELPYVGPHIDNESIITLVGMLSERSEYVGGENWFEPGSPRGTNRHFSLLSGDIVIFRGEELEHWITPVNSGTRCILQIEVSFSRNNRDLSSDSSRSGDSSSDESTD